MGRVGRGQDEMGRVNGERARCERDGADDVICVASAAVGFVDAFHASEPEPEAQNKSESVESQY